MNDEINLDFADVLRRISQLSKLQKKIRTGFEFTQNDKHSKKSKATKEEWLKIREQIKSKS